MNWNEPTWNELDEVWKVPDDNPKPEGAEISEHDFDMILEGADDDEY